ncbi:hypothetical protein ABW19_dt0204059 [Dactylella cylindrospora]|nr:hypothetical protein ABW19_dt0204059 [Dactylella cylindrospora]
MPNQRTILAAGIALVAVTTIWFAFSTSSLAETNVINTGDNRCPPAITVLASTCEITATLFETSTLVKEVTKTLAVGSEESTPAAHVYEDENGYPTNHHEAIHGADEDPVETPATPSTSVSQVDEALTGDDDDALHPAMKPSESNSLNESIHPDGDDQQEPPKDLTGPTAVTNDSIHPDEDDDPDAPTKPNAGPSSSTEEELPALTPTDDENFNLTEALTKYTCYPASEKEARQVAMDTLPSIKFNVVRGDNLVLSKKAKLPGQSFKTWYSVGRKPSAGCWTYNDRFGKYDEGTPRLLRSLGSLNSCKPDWNRAFVVHIAKGQAWSMPFIRHLRAVIAEAGWLGEYHVYLLTFVDGDKTAQEEYLTGVIPEPFRPLAITFNTEDLQTFLGSDVPFEKYESNMHVAVQKFMHDHEKYEFVYFVDSQTRLTGRWDTLLKNVEEEYAFHRDLKGEEQEMAQIPDLVTFEVTREPQQDWEALEWHCTQYFKGDSKDGLMIRRSLGAMGGFSRRMVDALAEVNSQKINCHSDYFAPTVASYKDLTTFFYQHPLYSTEDAESEGTTAKVGSNDAITVQQEKVAVDFSFSSETKDAQEFWEEWVSNPEVCRPEALLHPVSG